MKYLNLKKIVSKSGSILIFLLVLFILSLSVRGLAGNPDVTELNTDKWKETGPLELSPEKGRYALTYSLIEENTAFFSVPVARFVTPDLGYWGGKYVSLFAPGVSFVAIPGYIIGKSLGIAQVGTFAVIALFAAGNYLLISSIARILGANKPSAMLGGLIFLFATPAYAYAVTLYQHHVSTFLLLLSIFLLLKYEKRWWSLFSVWFLCAASLAIDNPNLFLMFPVGLAALLQFVDIHKNSAQSIFLAVQPWRLLTVFGIIIPVVLFGLFNFYTYGSPFRLAGTVPYIANIDEQGNPYIGIDEDGNKITEELTDADAQSAVGFFQTRNINNGLYIHLFSPDRGVILYTPVILVGLFGAYILGKKNNSAVQLLLAVTSVNLLLYSMWGDPWGGWAFGSRYLIPAYGVMGIFTSLVLTRYAKNILFTSVFALLMFYSLAVNSAGALTTNKVPPKIQIEQLESVSGRDERYSFDRNFEFLLAGGSKSFVYSEFAANRLSSIGYFGIVSGLIAGTGTVLLISNLRSGRKNHEK